MKFSAETKDFTTIKTDLLVVNMHDDKIDTKSFAGIIDKKLGGLLSKIVKNEKFKGKVGQSKLINTHGKIKADYLLLVGLGDKKKFNLEVVRKVSAITVKTAKQIRASRITTAVHGGHLGVVSKGECAGAVVEGFILGNYSFKKYLKVSKDEFKVGHVVLLCPDKTKLAQVKNAITKAEILSEGVCLARDLVNTTAKDMTPLALAKVAKGLKGVRTRIFNKAQIRKMKMESYLCVADGSDNPPAFIEMHYKPSGKSKNKIVFVGKGITFDSGGLSLKPAKYMETMKDDMSGAAGVIGLMSIISRLKPKAEVWGLVAATDNMPDAKSIKPGDIVKAMNGKTIEVLNTDAEGRLTLADALHYGISKKKPDYIIDAATLTGACLVALGDQYSAIMSNDEKLRDMILQASKKSGEKFWELPLAEEYKSDIKSPIADLKNVGGNYGGTITAGLFLQEFVGKTKWAHLDIAGPAWTDTPNAYQSKGGTGVTVRTYAAFLESF